MALTDVDRLFQRLVDVLGARGQDRLLEPIDFPDLYQTILPYRLHRTALRFDSNQDYEMALLRLLSGEQGYVQVEPQEVADALAEEARAVNPDPGAFRAYGHAKARLTFRAVKELLDARAPYEPPDVPAEEPVKPESPRTSEPARQLPFDLELLRPGVASLSSPSPSPAPRSPLPGKREPSRLSPATGGRGGPRPEGAELAAPAECPQCSRKLPQGRVINFCPHCGGNVKVRECGQCGSQLELEWRHCVNCGYRVT